MNGLIFANELLKASDATIALVDADGSPGGLWHQVADYSRVQQPLSSFGLSNHSIQDWQPDIREARRETVLAYCEHVLSNLILPSGRVSYFPKCDFRSDGTIAAIDTGQTQKVAVTQRLVNTKQSSRARRRPHIPCFSYSGPVQVLHPSNVSSQEAFVARQYEIYCILGSGRTASETALFLLEENIRPERIRWVKSREAWALSAATQNPSPERFKVQATLSLDGLRLMSLAQTEHDLYLGLERLGVLRRISPDAAPNGFSQQMLTATDAAKLSSIKGVIRKGHVHAISEIGMLLDQGAVPMPNSTLYIDCTRSRPAESKSAKIFQDGAIQLADVHLCQSSFSAAMIAAVELRDLPDLEKNALCAPVRGSNIASLFLTSILNNHAWFHDDSIRKWLATCHLDHFLQTAAYEIDRRAEIPQNLKAIRTILPRTIINLERLLEQSGAKDPWNS